MSDGRVALKLTLVTYEKGDKLGWLLSIISLAPVFLYVAETSLVLFRREYFGLALLFGQLVNEALNVILKVTFARPRPSRSEQNDYGMPSAHSQAMFFVTSCIIFTLSRRRHKPLSSLERNLLYSFLFLCSLSVSFSRIYLGYHSIHQVMVGALVGCLLGYFWTLYSLESNSRLLSALKSLAFLKLFYFKDSLEICHFLKREQLQYSSCNECAK
ncbi:Dolichyldiphosphatase 1 [Galdieria sulphuraria]|uniref:Dolichyldiphosphatase n=1 Tax=Galdieria sulphuraria TaxID=130081 RepID=M2VXR2_GALSU|nr:dolichyldiphosphatase [Galdieria sulphuraria]EME28076.1 dolichyldiphosphatase [Galdieria sulphuraria]GJD12112.1 Dolichyldiphosphatase 1 [Galdieria sulphuraria]|eukprot:XP_005704596.1 dolichyldiphosphatase [Galdieria sulphuraria]